MNKCSNFLSCIILPLPIKCSSINSNDIWLVLWISNPNLKDLLVVLVSGALLKGDSGIYLYITSGSTFFCRYGLKVVDSIHPKLVQRIRQCVLWIDLRNKRVQRRYLPLFYRSPVVAEPIFSYSISSLIKSIR